ncbi:MAG: hypothetical protein B6I38_07590 [Anaerolineaceae bacterium 4572_5.1]|nr:MAG: hypothetical protein B5M51_05435 [Anaerolinea sp. 4484_236]OQY30256.1 MAG: hypothetical protein B6I38_07590 [Anaerolineaceae bacterium 4572_5.1]
MTKKGFAFLYKALFVWMKSRDARDLNLRAVGQHLLGVNGIPLTPRICLGAAPKHKSRRSAPLQVGDTAFHPQRAQS